MQDTKILNKQVIWIRGLFYTEKKTPDKRLQVIREKEGQGAVRTHEGMCLVTEGWGPAMLKGQVGLEKTSVKAVQSCSQKLEWIW